MSIINSVIQRKYVKQIVVAGVLYGLPILTQADATLDAATEAAGFVTKFNTIILYPTIGLLSGVAFLVFLWGVAQYVMNADNDAARQDGVKHITFGIIGLFIMITAFAILALMAATFGLEKTLDCADNPVAGCEAKFKVGGK